MLGRGERVDNGDEVDVESRDSLDVYSIPSTCAKCALVKR